MKIVIDDNIPYIKGAFEDYAEVVYKSGSMICREDVIDADALIVRTRTKCNEELLHGSKIKLIVSATIGYDHLDIDYLGKNNIKWSNCPGCNSSSVQQYIASCLVTLEDKYKMNLENLTLGIIGCGYVGKKVKFIAERLGLRVLVNDPPRARNEGNDGFVDLATIQQEADIITIHTPLFVNGDDKTYHLINKQFLKKMKKSSFIINSSRGEIVNNEDLKEALKGNFIQGAVLDVWENEPNIDNALVDFLDIATSHIAGYAVDGKSTGTKIAVRTVGNFLNLKFDNWLPKGMPEIILDFDGLDLRKSILLTYDVINDDRLLRQDIKGFEKLRQNYPIRRDFSYFNATFRLA